MKPLADAFSSKSTLSKALLLIGLIYFISPVDAAPLCIIDDLIVNVILALLACTV